MTQREDRPGDDTGHLTVAIWLDRLAAPSGDVGGGAGCALLVATSAAQLAMVAGYTDEAGDRARRARGIRDAALRDADRDGSRSRALGDALRDGSDAEVRESATAAADSALKVGERAADMIEDWAALAGDVAEYLRPDVVVGVAALVAALQGAVAIAQANLNLAARRHADTDAAQSRVTGLCEARDRAKALLP